MLIRFFTVILLLALLSDSISGQEGGSFRIRNLTTQLTHTDSIKITFTIELISNSATNNGALRLTPTIINSENEFKLVSIYTKKQSNRFWRDEIIADSLMILSAGEATHYRTSIPFQEWMNGAKIVLQMERLGRRQSIILSKTLRDNLVLQRKRVVEVEQKKIIWQVTDKLEFIFSHKDIGKDVVHSIVSGDNATAIEALLKLEKSPNVWNTLGVAYGYSGEYDMARNCFEMAHKGGLNAASHNIGELNKKVTTKQR